MQKTIHTLAVFVLLAAVLLTGCTVRRAATTAAQTTEIAGIETTEQTTEWQLWNPLSETYGAEDCDVALPQERPLTTQEETSTEPVTEPAAETTAVPTTTTTTITTTTITTTTTTTTTTTATTMSTTAATSTTAAAGGRSAAQTVPATAKTTAATTAATAAQTTSQKQSAAPSTAKQILNRAVLHPQKTNDKELDDAVQQVFGRIFTPGMTTYDKVLACYNYIINNAEYGRPKMTVTQDALNAYQKEQDAWIVLFAKRILTNGAGVCDDYSALFLVMTRAIGLDCYYTHGCTTNTKGETNDHVWDTITVDGVDYIFDPQVEDKQSANGIKYTFFCKTYDSSIAKIYSGYDLAADKAAYNAFRRS